MSDLWIMFDEAYDAKNATARINKLQEIKDRWNLSYGDLIDAYNEYIDSDLFYANRGM